MAYAQWVAIVVQKYFGIDMYVYAFIFFSESPPTYQNSEHVLNLLTVRNKQSWIGIEIFTIVLTDALSAHAPFAC